eukprot:Transcript_2367.p1 GENE.Transcript_2367~~Transcript_2367.p1  ORF type:complete len:445 (+),score=98.89 Transcript_2367:99-1337(+)
MNPDDSDDEDTAPTYRSCAFGCDFASFGSVSCTPPNLSRESSLGGTATAMGSCALLTPTISRSALGEVQKNEYAKLNSYMGAAPQSGGFAGELSRAVCASTAPAGPLAPRRQAAVPHAPWDQHQLEAPTECRSAEGAEASNEGGHAATAPEGQEEGDDVAALSAQWARLRLENAQLHSQCRAAAEGLEQLDSLNRMLMASLSVDSSGGGGEGSEGSEDEGLGGGGAGGGAGCSGAGQLGKRSRGGSGGEGETSPHQLLTAAMHLPRKQCSDAARDAAAAPGLVVERRAPVVADDDDDEEEEEDDEEEEEQQRTPMDAVGAGGAAAGAAGAGAGAGAGASTRSAAELRGLVKAAREETVELQRQIEANVALLERLRQQNLELRRQLARATQEAARPRAPRRQVHRSPQRPSVG